MKAPTQNVREDLILKPILVSGSWGGAVEEAVGHDPKEIALALGRVTYADVDAEGSGTNLRDRLKSEIAHNLGNRELKRRAVLVSRDVDQRFIQNGSACLRIADVLAEQARPA